MNKRKTKTNMLTKPKYSLTAMENWQTVTAKTRKNAKSLSLRVILRVVPLRQQETVNFRQSFQSEVRF